MATKTYLLVQDNHNLLCTRYFFGNPYLVAEESGCRFYMTVHDSGAILSAQLRWYRFTHHLTMKRRKPSSASSARSDPRGM